MLKTVMASLKFMNSNERRRFVLLVIFRCLISIFDLAGILAIGYLATSMAMFVSGGSDPSRTIKVGSLAVPAVNVHTLPWVVVAILLAFTVKAVTSVALTRENANLIALVEARSAKVIASVMLGRGLHTVKSMSREELTFAIQTGSPSAFNGLLNAFSTAVSEGFLFVLLTSSFLIVNFWATIAMLGYFALIGFAIQVVVGGQTQRASLVLNESSIKAHNAINDLINGFRELTVLGKKTIYLDRIYLARKEAATQVANQIYLAGLPRYIVETALLFGIFAFGLVQAMNGDIVSSATTLGVFLTGGFRIMASMLPLQTALVSIKGSLPAATIALEIISKADTGNGQRQETLPTPADAQLGVSLRDVTYSYPGSEALAVKNINFEIEFGAQVALIGSSGAGKSTIADLIAGLIAPTSGAILISGVEPKALIAQHPGSIAYVPQFPGRLSGTLLENIAVGEDAKTVDQGALATAIEKAFLSDLVDELPEGVNTNMGKHSDSLSGGQLQRVGLARALYSNPTLLIMDEATSGLDAQTENEINLALQRIKGQTTVVLIAHRLNTVQRSDKVFLIDNGEIEASGKFQDLVKENAKVSRAAELMAIESD